MSAFKDKLPSPFGNVRIALTKDGEVIYEHFVKNLSVNGYKDIAIRLAGQDFSDFISKIAVGTGGHVPGDPLTPVVPLPTDTQLETQLGSSRNIDTISFPSAQRVKYTATFSTTEANGDLTEAGLFSTSDTMCARVTFPGFIKTGANGLSVDWEVFF